MNGKTKGILAALLLSAGLTLLTGCSGEPTPYETNDAEQYTVSVQYDANGGTFTTNTSIITDTYSLNDLTANGQGQVEIPLLAPDNEARGNDAFAPVKNGYFLAGWYAERTDNGDGTFTYGEKWDFEKDRLTAEADGTYSAAQPLLTLYAAWVPEFEIEFCSRTNGEVLNTLSFNPTTDGTKFKVPAWDKETGAMEMHKFPKREGYTFSAAYYDKAGEKPITKTLSHPGKVDLTTGTATDNKMTVYVDWMEGEWYHIRTAEQFLDNASVNGNYIIEADLDFADKTWPTSLMHGSFAGTIQGNGHTLKNITLTQTNNSKNNGGLFGQLAESATLSDVSFANVTFHIKKGTRVAGTAYGILAGTLADGAELSGVSLRYSSLQIDSGCYFGTDDYTIGLVCGIGEDAAVQTESLTCIAVGDAPETVSITQSGNEISLEFINE